MLTSDFFAGRNLLLSYVTSCGRSLLFRLCFTKVLGDVLKFWMAHIIAYLL